MTWDPPDLSGRVTVSPAQAAASGRASRWPSVSAEHFDDPSRYLGTVPYDVAKWATARMIAAMGKELLPHGVAVVGVYPGFTRTEAVVDAFRSAGTEPPEETHSPEFVGRAVAHVLADRDVLGLTGTGAQAATYAARYRFTDSDGRVIAPFVLPDDLLL
jgi:NAD(P)-dependent dehydrogenase (short-subunit alcohol dehydrogenase family)